MQRVFLLFLVLFCNCIYSQYTYIINSNRPGNTNSPYSVGTGIYQFEAGLYHHHNDYGNNIGGGLQFRTSLFFERSEILAKTKYDRFQYTDVNTDYKDNSFEFGIKYLLYRPTYTDKSKEIRSWKRRHSYDWRRLRPAVAIYLGTQKGSKRNSYDTDNSYTTKAGILLQQNLTDRFNLITNFYYNKLYNSYHNYNLQATATYSFSERISYFFEAEFNHNKLANQTKFGTGFAYLLNQNIQFDISGYINTYKHSKSNFVGIGCSYRIDRHKDDFTEQGENKQSFKNIEKLERKAKREAKRKAKERERQLKKEKREQERLEREIKKLEKELKEDESED